MSTTPDPLVQHRNELIARSDALRGELSQSYQRIYRQFETPVRAAGVLAGFVASLRQSPLLVTGVGLVLMKTPWRRLARLPLLVWQGWKILRFLRGLAR